MSRSYSLAYLTAPDCAPPDAVSLAADLGYRHIGVRILPAAKEGPFWPLLSDAAMLRETLARIKDRGVGVHDVEIVWLTPEFDASAHRKFFDVCAALRARAILVGGADHDIGRLTQSYAAFCAAAAPYGLTADLEFMPWTAVRDIETASRIVGEAGQPNCGILVDALHFARCGSTIDEVRAIPRGWLHYLQICDAPAIPPATTEGLIHAARRERLLPGDGGIALKDLFATMSADLPVSIEIPNDVRMAELGSREWARRAIAAARSVLEGQQ